MGTLKDIFGNDAPSESVEVLKTASLSVMKQVFIGARTLMKEGKHQKLGEFLAFSGNEYINQSPGRKFWACTRGCSYCCSLGVHVTPPEAFFIARTLRDQCSAEDLAEIKALLEDRSARAGAVADHDYANGVASTQAYLSAKIPCAFLTEDQSCGIHDFRPVACKSYASFDRDSCRDFAAQKLGSAMVSDEVAYILGSAALNGFIEAITQAHLDGQFYELHGAVLVAFRDGAEHEWESGLNPFVNCSVYTPVTPKV